MSVVCTVPRYCVCVRTSDVVLFRHVMANNEEDDDETDEAKHKTMPVASSSDAGQVAIRAWRDHDASVVETDVQIPGEGLLLLAAKAVGIGGGRWRY